MDQKIDEKSAFVNSAFTMSDKCLICQTRGSFYLFQSSFMEKGALYKKM